LGGGERGGAGAGAGVVMGGATRKGAGPCRGGREPAAMTGPGQDPGTGARARVQIVRARAAFWLLWPFSA